MDFRWASRSFRIANQLIVADRVKPEREHPRPIAAGLYGDLTSILTALTAPGGSDQQNWIAELRTAEIAARDLEKAELADDRSPLHPCVYAELARCSTRRHRRHRRRRFRVLRRAVIDSYLPAAGWTASFGCLGSVPVMPWPPNCAPRPSGRPVAGDGAFASAHGMDTLVRHGVPVVSVIATTESGPGKAPDGGAVRYSWCGATPGHALRRGVRPGGHGELCLRRPSCGRTGTCLRQRLARSSTCSPIRPSLTHAGPTLLIGRLAPRRCAAGGTPTSAVPLHRHRPADWAPSCANVPVARQTPECRVQTRSSAGGSRVPLICAKTATLNPTSEQPLLATARASTEKNQTVPGRGDILG